MRLGCWIGLSILTLALATYRSIFGSLPQLGSEDFSLEQDVLRPEAYFHVKLMSYDSQFLIDKQNFELRLILVFHLCGLLRSFYFFQFILIFLLIYLPNLVL